MYYNCRVRGGWYPLTLAVLWQWDCAFSIWVGKFSVWGTTGALQEVWNPWRHPLNTSSANQVPWQLRTFTQISNGNCKAYYIVFLFISFFKTIPSLRPWPLRIHSEFLQLLWNSYTYVYKYIRVEDKVPGYCFKKRHINHSSFYWKAKELVSIT